MRELMEAADVDGNKRIDYTEFLTAAMDQAHYHEVNACWTAFSVFDRDGSGTISKQELAQVMCDESVKSLLDSKAIEEVLAECDKDRDGQIDFDEFLAMMSGDGPRETY